MLTLRLHSCRRPIASCLQFVIVVAAASPMLNADSVQVTRLPLGIVYQQLFIEPHGRISCIFGQPQQTRFQLPSTITGSPTQLVVIDNVRGKKLASCKVSGTVEDALVDEHQIIWSPANVNLLHRLKFTGDQEVEQIVLDRSVIDLFSIGDDLFGVVSKQTSNSRLGEISVFSRRSLEPCATTLT